MTSADFLVHRSTEPNPRPLRQLADLFLPPIPAASTVRSLLVTGIVKMCSLTHSKQPPYAVRVHQYRILQSRFLQTCGHPQRPPIKIRGRLCDLLTGFTNSPVRDFHPLEYLKNVVSCDTCSAHAGRTQCV